MKTIVYLAVLAGLLTGAAAGETVFPKPGTPYAAARAALLKMGLAIATVRQDYASPQERAADRKKGIIDPEPVANPAPQFSEIDCWKLEGQTAQCRALFLETTKTGWKHYVIVPIAPENLMVG